MPALTQSQVTAHYLALFQETGECLQYTGTKGTSGYGRISTRVRGRLRSVAAHRVAWENVHGPIPPGLIVRHRCDNPLCIRPDHLELGTQADNIRDKMERNIERSKPPLLRVEVEAIRDSADDAGALACRYGVPLVLVLDIQQRYPTTRAV